MPSRRLSPSGPARVRSRSDMPGDWSTRGSMKRSTRAELARGTVEIVERGSYRSASGRVVDIAEPVRACLEATRYYPPEELERLRRDVLGHPGTIIPPSSRWSTKRPFPALRGAITWARASRGPELRFGKESRGWLPQRQPSPGGIAGPQLGLARLPDAGLGFLRASSGVVVPAVFRCNDPFPRLPDLSRR